MRRLSRCGSTWMSLAPCRTASARIMLTRRASASAAAGSGSSAWSGPISSIFVVTSADSSDSDHSRAIWSRICDSVAPTTVSSVAFVYRRAPSGATTLVGAAVATRSPPVAVRERTRARPRSATWRGSSRAVSAETGSRARSTTSSPSRSASASATCRSVARPSSTTTRPSRRRRALGSSRACPCAASADASSAGVSRPRSSSTSPSRRRSGATGPRSRGHAGAIGAAPIGGAAIGGVTPELSAVRAVTLTRSGRALISRPWLALARLRLPARPLLEVLRQPLQLRAQEVTSGHLAHRDPQRRDLTGEVLGVRDGPLAARPVLLVLHAVAVRLPVLREQDERRGVRRLQRQEQREERERVRVEPPVAGGECVPPQPHRDEQRHVADEAPGAEKAGDALGQPPEHLRVVVHPGHHPGPQLPRLVQPPHGAFTSHAAPPVDRHHAASTPAPTRATPFSTRPSTPPSTRPSTPPAPPLRQRRCGPRRVPGRASPRAAGGRGRRRR